MKKVIKLSEQDLHGIVKRIISEVTGIDSTDEYEPLELPSEKIRKSNSFDADFDEETDDDSASDICPNCGNQITDSNIEQPSFNGEYITGLCPNCGSMVTLSIPTYFGDRYGEPSDGEEKVNVTTSQPHPRWWCY